MVLVESDLSGSLFRILFRLGTSVLEPILRPSAASDKREPLVSTHIHFVKRDLQRLGKLLLDIGARLVLFLEMRLENVMLLFGEAWLHFAGHRRHSRVVHGGSGLVLQSGVHGVRVMLRWLSAGSLA